MLHLRLRNARSDAALMSVRYVDEAD